MSVIRLAAASEFLGALEPNVLFSDVDGTLVGRNGSLFATTDGTPTLDAANALYAAHQAGLQIVLMSGRARGNVLTTCRVLGIQDAIAELGTSLLIDGEHELIWGDVPRGLAATPALTMQASGALDWLLGHYAGHLEPHEPLPQERQGTILLRGQLDPSKANAELADAGFPWVELVDNGRFNRPFAHLGARRTHAFHLVPKGVNKATAAELYLKRKGLSRRHAAAIGDAPSDLQLANAVGAMFMVANGSWAVADDEQRMVILTEGSAGRGWAEAVTVLLASR